MKYRTEIVVPEDRYVCVLLPDYLPIGRAVLTISLEGKATGEAQQTEPTSIELDRDDIEWWDEFEAAGEAGGTDV